MKAEMIRKESTIPGQTKRFRAPELVIEGFCCCPGLNSVRNWKVNIAVEVAIIDSYAQAVVPSTVVQQVLFPVLGLLMIGLALFLWRTGILWS